MYKTCGKCKEKKDKASFNKKKREKDGLQPYCRDCDNAHRRKYYKKSKGKWKEYREKFRNTIKEWWQDYRKELVCSRCGDERWYVLDFHHRNPTEKERAVSEMVFKGWSKKRILLEVSKCDVLCANCHREIHFLEKSM